MQKINLGKPLPGAVQSLVVGLLFLMPVVMGTVQHAASALYMVLLLLSLFFLRNQWQGLAREEKRLMWLLIAAFGLIALSIVNADDVDKYFARLDRLLRVLAFIPIYLLLRQLSVNALKAFAWGLILAGPALLVSGFIWVTDGRSAGAYNFILFGDFTACVVLALLPVIAFQKHSVWFKALALASVACAAIALVMSGTRGAWIAIPVAGLALLGFYIFEAQNTAARVRRLFAGLVCIAVVITAAVSLPGMQERWQQAQLDISQYMDGSNPHTSLGYRLQMWQAALDMWKRDPLLGSGLGDYGFDLQQMMASGESNIQEHFGEGHSLYFEFLGTTGLLGLFSLMIAMFLYPLWLALKTAVRDQDAIFLKASIVSLVLAFMVFGISQNWLSRSSITSVYFVFLAFYLAELYRRKPGST
jgi:O-antigen ligase